MIISQNSFAGMGKFGSMYLGENLSNETDMSSSFMEIISSNIAGI